MGHEISQYDIPDRQLLATKAQSRAGMGKDIGEAKIIHTIFGRAKVRVIREQDKKRRAWLLAALVVMALAAAAWQGWVATNRTTAPPLSTRVQVSAPAFQPEYIPPAATPPSERSKPGTPLQTEINRLMTSQKSAPQPPLGLKASEQIVAKPVTAQPLATSKPQTASLAENNNSAKNQTDLQQPPKLSVPIQTVAPIVATPPATQPAPGRPAAVAPLEEPLIEENTPTLSPAGGNQPSVQ